ncbi:MAG: redox-regulated ATPase YchF [Firmicutes bacterium]|nr:redox-regulated ATPase YchF [Bacillota bacterium]
MKIGIIGMPQSGKSTLFRLLTNSPSGLNGKAAIAVGKVPDPRIDRLSEIFQPRKTTYAAIDFVDVPGLTAGPGSNASEFFEKVRDVDALVLVVRTFAGGTQPAEEFNQIQQELLIADWSILERRLERVAKQRMKNPSGAAELAVLEKCKAVLEEDLPLRQLPLSAEEEQLIRDFNFLTKKPLIVVVNVDEDQMRRGSYPQQKELEDLLAQKGIMFLVVCGQLEMEISQLDAEDAALFLEELGLTETGIARLAQVVYSSLGLISFFTVGEDEVRAWTIRDGFTARKAAGKIHSDIERGFIRAEVASYDDFMAYGSMQKLKEKGLLRLEGKDYLVKDGDIISFRFNV